MTDAELLQLRLDILDAASGASKPVPHHVIGDWLAGTASKPLIRYNLRVIDALVETGEIVRHINVEGGRNTYTAGTANAAASIKRLRLLFADDIGSTIAEPAPAPTAKPAPTPAAKSMPNVTVINPNAKPEPYRPTDPLKARILGLIDDTQQCTRAYLVSRLHDVDEKHIDNNLWALCKDGRLARAEHGTYTRAAGVTAASAGTSIAPRKATAAAAAAVKARPATAEESSAVARKPPVFVGPITTLDGEITDSPARDLPPAIAAKMLHVVLSLQGLGATLRDHANAERPPAPKPVADLDTKVAVLRKLAPMVAADISAVLDAVANDLQAMAVAA